MNRELLFSWNERENQPIFTVWVAEETGLLGVYHVLKKVNETRF